MFSGAFVASTKAMSCQTASAMGTCYESVIVHVQLGLSKTKTKRDDRLDSSIAQQVEPLYKLHNQCIADVSFHWPKIRNVMLDNW